MTFRPAGRLATAFAVLGICSMLFLSACGGGGGSDAAGLGTTGGTGGTGGGTGGGGTGGGGTGGGGTGGGTGGIGEGTGASSRMTGSALYDGASAVAVDPAGNVYVTGNTWGSVQVGVANADASGRTSDIFVAKYSSTGVLSWVRQYGSALEDEASAIAIDNTGSVYVTGRTSDSMVQGVSNLGSYDVFLLKLSASTGDQVWGVQEGGPGTDELWGVAVDRAGNVYVAGSTTNGMLGVFDNGVVASLVASYDSAGSIRWGGTGRLVGRPGAYRQVARALAVDSVRGFVYVTGESWAVPFGVSAVPDPDIFVDKLNLASGANEWTVPFLFGVVEGSVPQQDYSTSIALDADGNAYVAGYEVTNRDGNPSNAGDVRLKVFKIDPDEGYIWHTYVPGTVANGVDAGNAFRSIAVDAMGDIYVAGYVSVGLASSADAIGGVDAVLMQLDSTGAIQWTRQFGSTGNDRAWGVAVDYSRAGNVYVVGESSGVVDSTQNAGGYDAFLVRYNAFGDRL